MRVIAQVLVLITNLYHVGVTPVTILSSVITHPLSMTMYICLIALNWLLSSTNIYADSRLFCEAS